MSICVSCGKQNSNGCDVCDQCREDDYIRSSQLEDMARDEEEERLEEEYQKMVKESEEGK